MAAGLIERYGAAAMRILVGLVGGCAMGQINWEAVGFLIVTLAPWWLLIALLARLG